MTRSPVAAVALVVASVAATALLVSGCKQEPTIVIKFEPNDMTGGKGAAADLASRAPADLGGRAADLAASKAAAGKAAGAQAGGKRAGAECRVAADCAVEPLDCCDCANGGKQHAIPKKLAAAAQAARQARCKNTVCTMMLSTDPSCGQRADCVDGKCVMVKK